MSEATSRDSDPNNPQARIRYKAVYQIDHAQQEIERVQKDVERAYTYTENGVTHQADTSGFVWSVRRIEKD